MEATRRRDRAGRARRVAVMVPVGAVLLLVAGCGEGSGGGGLYGGSDTSTSAGATEGGSATSGSAGGGKGGGAAAAATVEVGDTSLGQVLVDGDGRTLYMFDKDTNGGPSTCYDECAAAWPPLLTSGSAAGEGIDEAKLGTTERDDGTTQVTYAGWPLYYWAQDAAPGDVDGQGVNGVWWVLTADGQPHHG